MPYLHPYCRVSSDQQTLDQQEYAIKAYYNAHLKDRFTWVNFYVDPETSASIEFRARDAGRELDSRLCSGDAVVVTKLDRAWRSVRDALTTIDDWGERGVELHIIDLHLDTSTPMGRCIFTVLAAFAELERKMTSIRVREKNAQRRRLGNAPPGGQPGFGWRWLKSSKRVAVPKQVNGVWKQKLIWEKKRLPDIIERQLIVLAGELAEDGYNHYDIYTTLSAYRTDDGRRFLNSLNRLKAIMAWMALRFTDTGRTDLDCLWDYGDDNPNTAKEPLVRLRLEELKEVKRPNRRLSRSKNKPPPDLYLPVDDPPPPPGTSPF